MLKSRVLTGALIAGAVAVTSLFAASPASAATLPDGQKITVEDWDTFQFSYASPVDATLTEYGTQGIPDEDEWLEAIDVDNDGFGYAITTWYSQPVIECEDEEEEGPCFSLEYVPFGASLYTADANAGSIADGIQIYVRTDPMDPESWEPVDACYSIDYTDGVITTACYIYGDGGPEAYIGTVDPDTARLYTDVQVSGFSYEFLAIAKNPIDGKLYGFSPSGDYVYEIILDGVEDDDEPVYLGYTDLTITGADFDSSGQLWATARSFDIPALIPDGDDGLVTIELAGETEPYVFPFAEPWSDQTAEINAITVWGAALPATGPGDPSVPLYAAALALLAGTLLAGVSVLRRRGHEVRA